ncbi:MAG: SRPBCC domain-containing protein [Candidatus Hydrogenedentes bacterium]|nr:SRPBCC domain-containing protein [Candidatus Hydrogenedentota bacterium]
MNQDTPAAVATPPQTDPEVRITRIFDAPRELVFHAWTDPLRLTQWYAPRGCTFSFSSVDLREGGAFHSCIHTPDGHNCWCIGAYLEITPSERIVFTMAVADEHGDAILPADAGMDPAWPAESRVTVTFADLGGKTRLTLHQTVSETLAKRTGAHPSWLQMLDRLAEELATRV